MKREDESERWDDAVMERVSTVSDDRRRTNEALLDENSSSPEPDFLMQAASASDSSELSSFGAGSEVLSIPGLPDDDSEATCPESHLESTTARRFTGDCLKPLSNRALDLLALMKWHTDLDMSQRVADYELGLVVLAYQFEDFDNLSPEELETKRGLDKWYDWVEDWLNRLAEERRFAMKCCAATGCCRQSSTCDSGLGDPQNWRKHGDECMELLCQGLVATLKTKEGSSARCPQGQDAQQS